MHTKLIALGIVILALIVAIGWVQVKPTTFSSNSISPNILTLTSPITSFSGQVEKVSGNEITVTSTVYSTSTVAPAVAAKPGDKVPTPEPTKPPVTLTYRVTFDNTTTITKTSPLTAVAAATKVEGNSIQVGDFVTTTSPEDLRTLRGDSFKATAIIIQSTSYSINGKVTKVEGNRISVMGMLYGNNNTPGSNAQPQSPKEYTLVVDKDTILVRVQNEGPTKPVTETKLTLGDFKKDMQVNGTAIKEGDMYKAVRLEPMQVVQTAPVASPSSAPTTTPSAQLSPSKTP